MRLEIQNLSNKYRKEINPWASLVTSRDSYNNSNAVKAYRYPSVSDTRKRKYSYYVNDTTQTNSKHWISDVGNNIREPSVYGWSEET